MPYVARAREPHGRTRTVCHSLGARSRQICPLFRCTSERTMAKSGIAVGLNKAHVVTQREKKLKPSHSKGVRMHRICRHFTQ